MMNSDQPTPEMINSSVAIIGMSGRFPDAKNIDEFWQNLKNGLESISFFSDEELSASGVDPALWKKPSYVRAKGVLSDIEMFDAHFFGFNPREAEITDVQHRIFLECAWEAIESAGYDPDEYDGLIGVYAGMGMSTYFLNHVLPHTDHADMSAKYQMMISNDKDFLTTITSYKLNLKGPSVCIQTACSTSLVAVHFACQGLLNGECDMALAGGVSVDVPQKTGYLYQEGMILSPDGHCRAFDARASGTVGGNGCGIVMLKRLEDALRDRDMIHAIIRGSAVNNDGSSKVGFTAPGVEGQVAVISEAYAVADVEPETISYIETHGTGTLLGDPIEISALTQAFKNNAKCEMRNVKCAIGSVKTNVGHLNAAAGVAGLIKTVLALRHEMIPPSLNHEHPNPRIDFAGSPFFVNTRLSEWKTDGNPRRAGVSSFGIGGTNAHVVLEEMREEMRNAKCEVRNERPFQLLVLSAKTETALDAATGNLAEHLRKHPDSDLADAAYTLRVGRKSFGWKRMLVCRDTNEAIRLLSGTEPSRVFTGFRDDRERQSVFMFSGQGSQYANMGSELYRTEPVFREITDQCSEMLKPHIGIDLREILYPETAGNMEDSRLRQTAMTQPALLVIEYALAKLWMSWGIKPCAMIGHSIGEYVAACLAGVFSLEDALFLVTARGKMMQEMPEGAMLAVPLSEKEVTDLLNKELSLAAVNAPSLCVVSGTTEAIEKLQDDLAKQKIECSRLHTSHAFHSEMMEPIVNSFTELVKKIRPNPPRIPYISNVSGTWITASEATDPEYWGRHLRQTVRFSDGLRLLLKEPEQILLEVGPGRTLSQLAMRHFDKSGDHTVLTSLRHPHDKQSDSAYILMTLGRLWLAGVRTYWAGFHADERRLRIPLPTYPFERQRCWIEKEIEERSPRREKINVRTEISKDPDIGNWSYVPSWQRSVAPVPDVPFSDSTLWLIFSDQFGVGDELAKRLNMEPRNLITVEAGSEFARLDHDSFSVNPDRSGDYEALFDELGKMGRIPHKIIHLRSITQGGSDFGNPCSGFYDLLFIAQAIGKHNITDMIRIIAVSDDMQDVSGEEAFSCPEKAAMLGPLTVMGEEFPNIRCRSIDISLPLSKPIDERLIDRLAAELVSESDDPVVAFRGNHRWVRTFEPFPFPSGGETLLKEKGVYLITGGLGGIGLVLAKHLAETKKARLILTGRTSMPLKERWDDLLSDTDTSDDVRRKIRKVMELESLGAEVLVVAADVANFEDMKNLMARIENRFGLLNGVIHAAGITSAKSVKLIRETDVSDCERQFRPKMHGLIALEKAMGDKSPDFCLLMSSLSSVLGGLGFVAYSAANLFMDAFAQQRNRSSRFPWISVNWDGWKTDDAKHGNSPVGAALAEMAITPEEGIRVFKRIMSSKSGIAQIIVSTGDLQARIDKWIRHKTLPKKIEKTSSGHARPNLPTPYIAPRNEPEKILAEIFRTILGFEKVGVCDNFFDLGGDSLLATQVASRIREAFETAIPLSSMFDKPTVEGLAELVIREKIEQKDQDEMVRLLEKLEQMPEEEARKLLGEKH